MDRLAKLVIGSGLLCAACAHAFYAGPSDPKGFVRSGSWGAGYGYAIGANDSTFGKIIHQPNGLKLNVGGKMVTMSASYKLAANAPRIAAGVLFMNPAVRFGLGIAAWLGVGKLIWDEANQVWRQEGEKDLEGKLYSVDGVQWSSNKGSAINSIIGKKIGDGYTVCEVQDGPGLSFKALHGGAAGCGQPNRYEINLDVSIKDGEVGCPPNWIETPGGCLSPAVPQPLFEEILSPSAQPSIMPETVPQELPDGMPLPVEPTPWVNPQPGTNPQHRPMFIPSGDPVPNPNYDPNAAPSPENQPYIQPGTRLNPSPAPNDPWRMDVKPIDRPKPDNTPMPGPEAEPSPDPQPGDKSKPEESPGLCDLYPDILACVKLDTPDDQDIPASEKPISITPDSGWGPDGGTCPAPKVIMTQGRSIPIPFDLFCTYMQGMRPIIIAMAWLSAAFILIGAREGN